MTMDFSTLEEAKAWGETLARKDQTPAMMARAERRMQNCTKMVALPRDQRILTLTKAGAFAEQSDEMMRAMAVWVYEIMSAAEGPVHCQLKRMPDLIDIAEGEPAPKRRKLSPAPVVPVEEEEKETAHVVHLDPSSTQEKEKEKEAESVAVPAEWYGWIEQVETALNTMWAQRGARHAAIDIFGTEAIPKRVTKAAAQTELDNLESLLAMAEDATKGWMAAEIEQARRIMEASEHARQAVKFVVAFARASPAAFDKAHTKATAAVETYSGPINYFDGEDALSVIPAFVESVALREKLKEACKTIVARNQKE